MRITDIGGLCRTETDSTRLFPIKATPRLDASSSLLADSPRARDLPMRGGRGGCSGVVLPRSDGGPVPLVCSHVHDVDSDDGCHDASLGPAIGCRLWRRTPRAAGA